MSSDYKPPAQFEVSKPAPIDYAAKKRDPRYIKLQQVEHQISEFNLLKIYVTIILLVILAKLFMAAIINDDDYYAPFSRTFEVCTRTFQLIGYAYGLQAHLSKSYRQGRYFLMYVIASFVLISYQLAKGIQGDEHGPSILNVSLVSLNFFFNIFLAIYTTRFIKALKERDELKKSLEVKFEP